MPKCVSQLPLSFLSTPPPSLCLLLPPLLPFYFIFLFSPSLHPSISMSACLSHTHAFSLFLPRPIILKPLPHPLWKCHYMWLHCWFSLAFMKHLAGGCICLQSMTPGQPWCQEHEAVCPLSGQIKKQEEMNSATYLAFSLLFSLGSQHTGCCHPYSEPIPSVNPYWQCLSVPLVNSLG